MEKLKKISRGDPRPSRLKVSEGGEATFYVVREGSVQHTGSGGRAGEGKMEGMVPRKFDPLQLKFLVAPLGGVLDGALAVHCDTFQRALVRLRQLPSHNALI